MSDTIDLTMLSGSIQEMQRDLRLLRLQADTMAARNGTLDQRMGTLEQAIHGTINEIGRGFDQLQQQVTRLERRIDGVDAELTALREAVDTNAAQIIAAITGQRP
jgi:chromosome segregation ATPase